jgi:hypothetical protein
MRQLFIQRVQGLAVLDHLQLKIVVLLIEEAQFGLVLIGNLEDHVLGVLVVDIGQDLVRFEVAFLYFYHNLFFWLDHGQLQFQFGQDLESLFELLLVVGKRIYTELVHNDFILMNHIATYRTQFCQHNHSCAHNCVKGAVEAFGKAFLAKLCLNALFTLLSIKKIMRSNARIKGLILSLVNKYYNHDQPEPILSWASSWGYRLSCLKASNACCAS